MDVASAKLIGAGLAAIGVGAASLGVGFVFGSFLQSAIRNPAASDGQPELRRTPRPKAGAIPRPRSRPQPRRSTSRSSLRRRRSATR